MSSALASEFLFSYHQRSPTHEFKSWLYLLLVVWPWASYLIIQDLFSYGYNGDVTLLRLVVVQSLSRVQLFEIPWTAAHQAHLSFTISQNVLKFTSIESVMPSNHLILCCPLLLLPSIFPRNRVFSNESAPQVRWPKYWSFSFNIRSSNEYSGLISFRIDWFDLLAVQSTP